MRNRTVFAEGFRIKEAQHKTMKKKRYLRDRAGVTLVELITVLVILSVLAAVMVPSLLGFIDKVKVRRYVVEANSVRSSAQMLVTEEYAAGTLDDMKIMSILVGGELDSETHALYPYLKVTCSPGARLSGATIESDKGKVVELIYQVGGYTITVNESGTEVEETALARKGHDNKTDSETQGGGDVEIPAGT